MLVDVAGGVRARPDGHRRGVHPTGEKIASAGPIYFTTEGAVELAERIARSTPGDLDRVFLTSSGSEATETAVKLARQYHRLRGDHHRFKFISRYGSYHGAGMGGTSIGGRRRRDSLYYPLVPGTVNIQPPTGTDDIVAAEALRTAIEMEGPETVAAFIGEPVAIMQFTIPDADYWPRVREICDEYGVLMIADETLTGCCRTGRFWGIDNWGVTPDVLVAAKAVSSGYAPVAAMVVREHVYEAFGDAVPSPSVQSYGGHGASAAAGARAFEVYETERMDEVAERRGAELEARLAHLARPPAGRATSGGSACGSRSSSAIRRPGESLARGLHGRWAVAPLLSRAASRARLRRGTDVRGPPARRAAATSATDSDFDSSPTASPRVLDAAAPLIARTVGRAPTHHRAKETTTCAWQPSACCTRRTPSRRTRPARTTSR